MHVHQLVVQLPLRRAEALSCVVDVLRVCGLGVSNKTWHIGGARVHIVTSIDRTNTLRSVGVRMPATTSSPQALLRYSPVRWRLYGMCVGSLGWWWTPLTSIARRRLQTYPHKQHRHPYSRRHAPKFSFSPVLGLRVNMTPVPLSSPMLPKTCRWCVGLLWGRIMCVVRQTQQTHRAGPNTYKVYMVCSLTIDCTVTAVPSESGISLYCLRFGACLGVRRVDVGQSASTDQPINHQVITDSSSD